MQKAWSVILVVLVVWTGLLHSAPADPIPLDLTEELTEEEMAMMDEMGMMDDYDYDDEEMVSCDAIFFYLLVCLHFSIL